MKKDEVIEVLGGLILDEKETGSWVNDYNLGVDTAILAIQELF